MRPSSLGLEILDLARLAAGRHVDEDVHLRQGLVPGVHGLPVLGSEDVSAARGKPIHHHTINAEITRSDVMIFVKVGCM